jgi:hypothetical protein
MVRPSLPEIFRVPTFLSGPPDSPWEDDEVLSLELPQPAIAMRQTIMVMTVIAARAKQE